MIGDLAPRSCVICHTLHLTQVEWYEHMEEHREMENKMKQQATYAIPNEESKVTIEIKGVKITIEVV